MMASNSVSKQRSDSLPLADHHHYRHLHQEPGYHDINYSSIDNGNWTEWSPIRSVIVRVITKPRSGSPVCLITSMKGRAEGRVHYSCFEKGCRNKCTRQPRKALWVVFSSLFFKEISKNGTRGHGRMSARAKGNNKSRFDSYSVKNKCIDHIPYYLSGLSRAQFLRQPFSK